MLKILGFFMGSVMLVSCTKYFPDHEKDYLKSQNEKVLIVPPGLSDNNMSRAYVLPSLAEKQNIVEIEPPVMVKKTS